MKKVQLRNSLLLLLTATIWGTAFVAQSVGMDYIGPFTFNAIRCIIGGIVLIPIILIMGKVKKESKNKNNNKQLILGGILCGIALFTGSTLQQFGISFTSVGKAGFITALYIVLVPILGIFFKKKVLKNIKFCFKKYSRRNSCNACRGRSRKNQWHDKA